MLLTFYNVAEFGTMTRNQVLYIESGEFIDAFLKLQGTAAVEISPANSAVKNYISGYEQLIVCPIEANRAGRMTWSIKDLEIHFIPLNY